MRSILTSALGLAFLAFAASFAATKPSCAASVINVCGKFSFWVPDDWKATQDSDNIARTTFESADGELSLVAGPLSDVHATLDGDGVADFADEELDEMKVTSDKPGTLDTSKIRLLQGLGKDGGDSVVFRMLALQNGTKDPVIAVMVYGAQRQMLAAANQPLIDKILHGLKPQ